MQDHHNCLQNIERYSQFDLFKTSIVVCIKNPFRRTSDHNHMYIYIQLPEFLIYSPEIIPFLIN